METIHVCLDMIQTAKAEISSKLSSKRHKSLSSDYNANASNQMIAFVSAAGAYVACCSTAVEELKELNRSADLNIIPRQNHFTRIITSKFPNIRNHMAKVLIAYTEFSENPNRGNLFYLEDSLAPTINAYSDTTCE